MLQNKNFVSRETAEKVKSLLGGKREEEGADSLFYKIRPVRITSEFSGGCADAVLLNSESDAVGITLYRAAGLNAEPTGASGTTAWAVYRGRWEEIVGGGAPGPTGQGVVFFNELGGTGSPISGDIIRTPHFAAGAYLGAANGGPCSHSDEGDGQIGLLFWKGADVNGNNGVQEFQFADGLQVAVTGNTATISATGSSGPTGPSIVYFDSQGETEGEPINGTVRTPHIAAGAYLGAANGGGCTHSSEGDGIIGLLYWKGADVNGNHGVQIFSFGDGFEVNVEENSANISVTGTITGPTGPTGPAGESITGPTGPAGDPSSFIDEFGDQIVQNIYNDYSQQIAGDVYNDYSQQIAGDVYNDYGQQLAGDVAEGYGGQIAGSVYDNYGSQIIQDLLDGHQEDLRGPTGPSGPTGENTVWFEELGDSTGDAALSEAIEVPHIGVGAYLAAANGGDSQQASGGSGKVGVVYWKGFDVDAANGIQKLEFTGGIEANISGNTAVVQVSGPQYELALYTGPAYLAPTGSQPVIVDVYCSGDSVYAEPGWVYIREKEELAQ